MASQDSKINSTNVGVYDYFGSSVGISGINSNTYKVIVGAYNNLTQGNVYVFSNTSTTNWSSPGTSLISSNIEVGDNFGYSVDVSEDYSRYIVGAPYKDNNKGRVYIYNTSYSQTEIFAPDSGNFGHSVALNGDGTKAIVGAPYNGSDMSGNVYTYSSSNWSSPTYLYPSSPSDSALFGYSVHISSDGSKTIVGEPYENAENHGAAYIFNSSGNQEVKLSPSDTYIDGNFGYSVNIDSDGNTAVIGSIGSDNRGAAYVFTRSGTTWTQEAKLVSSDIAIGDNFGHSVCISNDGDTVMVSTPFKSSRGAVYVFTRTTGTSIWTQRDKILSNDLSTGDKFGNSIAISPNSLKAIIGASGETPSNIFSGGSVYSYTLPENYSSNINRITHTEDPGFEDIGTFETFNLYINGQPIENKPTTWLSNSYVMSTPSSSNIFFANVPYSSNLSTLEPISDIKIGNFTFLERNVYDTWDNTALDFYGEGPPNQMLSVGGEAIIEQKLGIGVQIPVKPIHVLGDMRLTDQKPTNTSVDISSKSSIFRQTFEIVPVSQKTYEVQGTFLTISPDGTTAAVTSYTSPPGNDTFWYVYIYNWNGSLWEQNAILQPDIIVSNDQFGSSIAFSSDGNTIVIGAYGDESVYVFSRGGFNSISWSQEFKIKESVSTLGNQFGYSVDINGEGSTIVVGSPKSDDDKGSIYVYTRSANSSWSETKLIQANVNTGHRLGSAVSITPDGNTILGTAERGTAYFAGTTSGGIQGAAGAAYIWKKSGSTWSQLTWYPSPNYNEYPVAAGLSVSNTVPTSNIFSYGHSTPGQPFGSYTNQSATRLNDSFGTSCDISDDGNTIIIGAPGRSQQYYYSYGGLTDYNIGSVYIFKYKYTGAPVTGYSWVENAHIQASDFKKYDYFGTSVALSSDGNTAIIGSPRHDSSNVKDSGAVYIFTYSGISWSQQYKVTPPVPVINGTFGQCVCLSRDGLVTMLSNNAMNVFKPVKVIGLVNSSGAEVSVSEKYFSTNFYGEYNYQIVVHGNGVSTASHNDLKYNPYTKRWVAVPNPASAILFSWRLTNSTVYVDSMRLENPEYVYIWDYRTPSSYLFSFKNPYFNDGYYNSSNVYTYSLPEDYSKQYINTLKVTSNLHVNENITTPNRIGINITTPEKDLHVKGDFRITDESENVDFSIIKENTYEESFLTLPLTGEDILDSYDHYGKCVCISGDGSTIAIASHHSDGTLSSQSDPGKVHIYTRTGNKWSQQVILQPYDVTASGHFGEGLSFSHDGTTLAIGAYNTTVTAYSNTYTNAGAVYVYSRSGRILSGGETEAIKGTWTLENKLIPPLSASLPESNSFFGYNVSMNDIGTIVLITAKNEESNKGAFYTYAITGVQKWDCMDRTPGSSSGDLVYSVKISGNGQHCVVGEIGVNSGAGRVQFYTQYLASDVFAPAGDISGTSAIQWNLVQTITPTDLNPGDSLGTYIAIDEIGSTLALSAPNQNSNSGAVYVYTRSSGSVWTQETKLTSLDSGGLFGHDIQLSSDGTRLAIGQPNSGDSVYLYEKIDSKWGIKTKLTASYDGIIPTAVANIGTPTTDYGYSVSMTSDGDRIIVGDHQKTINNMISAGASYIYNIPTITNTSLRLSTSVKTDNDLLVHRNTGLGIESPEKKLHVLGDIRLTNTDDVDISVLSSVTTIEKTIYGLNKIEGNYVLGRGMDMTRDGDIIAFTDGTYGAATNRLYLFKRSGSIWYKYSEYTISGNSDTLSLSGDGKRIAFRTEYSTTIINTVNPHYRDQVILQDSDSDIFYMEWVGDSYNYVKLSEDGDTLLVSYPQYELTPLYDSYSSNVVAAGVVDVYVYSGTDNSWSRQARLKSNTPTANDEFGRTIDITGDGNRVFVRAPDRVEIFQRSGTNWSHLQTISNPVTNDNQDVFGYGISVSSDGRNVAISDPFYDTINVTFHRQGKVYTYYYNGSSYDTGSNDIATITGAQNDYLGYETRLSGDGKTLLVSTRARDSSLLFTGKTHRYTETNSSYISLSGYSPSWSLTEELVPEAKTIPENYPLYGQNICVNYKGDRCAILMANGGGTSDRAINFIDIHNLSVTNEPTLNISKNLHVEDSLSVGNLKPSDKRGAIHIYEPVGSSHHSTNDASLVLEHGDSGGSSCILFPSARNVNSDYGYIQYEDSTLSGDEKSRLIIGTQNDGVGINSDNVILNPSGAVGIKTTNPTCYLDLGSTVVNRIISLYGGSSSGSTNYYGLGINSSTLRFNADSSGAVHRFYGGSTSFGYVNNGTGFVNTFTGQHKSFPHESLSGKTVDELSGLIVCASGEHISVNDAIPQRGQDGITISEAVPSVKLSVTENEKTVFGVVSNVEDPESTEREDRSGAFTSTFIKLVGDTRIYVNSIGEGAVWVVNTNGSFVNGDYITTSNVAGYGQKQVSDSLKNYTVAKITMDCDFVGTTAPKKRIKKKTVTETLEETVEEEYEDNMPEDVYTYDVDHECYVKTVKDNITTKTRSVMQEYELRDSDGNVIIDTASNTPVVYSGNKIVVKTVTHEVYDLDEHGQIQWEDDPTETEKAYKIRYLDANGVITDEANAVHTAAFVGCTYHCG